MFEDFDMNGALDSALGAWSKVETAKQAKEAIKVQNAQPVLPTDQAVLQLQMQREAAARNGTGSMLLLVGGALVIGLIVFMAVKK